MSSIPLQNWNAALEVIWLDPTGSLRVQKLPDLRSVADLKCQGFAVLFRDTLLRKHCAAVYANRGGKTLQVDSAHWFLGEPGIQLSLTSALLWKRFKVMEAGAVRLSLYYLNPILNPLVWIDMTVDEIDEESEDFLFWVTKRSQSRAWCLTDTDWRPGVGGRTADHVKKDLQAVERLLRHWQNGSEKTALVQQREHLRRELADIESSSHAKSDE